VHHFSNPRTADAVILIQMGGLDREEEGMADRVRPPLCARRGEGKTLFDAA
jgi:hypothetical protein